jgi:hypothetical protein
VGAGTPRVAVGGGWRGVSGRVHGAVGRQHRRADVPATCVGVQHRSGQCAVGLVALPRGSCGPVGFGGSVGGRPRTQVPVPVWVRAVLPGFRGVCPCTEPGLARSRGRLPKGWAALGFQGDAQALGLALGSPSVGCWWRSTGGDRCSGLTFRLSSWRSSQGISSCRAAGTSRGGAGQRTRRTCEGPTGNGLGGVRAVACHEQGLSYNAVAVLASHDQKVQNEVLPALECGLLLSSTSRPKGDPWPRGSQTRKVDEE